MFLKLSMMIDATKVCSLLLARGLQTIVEDHRTARKGLFIYQWTLL